MRLIPNLLYNCASSSVAENVLSLLMLFRDLTWGVSVFPRPKPTDRKKSAEDELSRADFEMKLPI